MRMNDKLNEDILRCLAENKPCNLVTKLSSEKPNTEVTLERCLLAEGAEGFSYEPSLKREGDALLFFEPIAKKERLIILGGGHISRWLCSFAAQCGFCVWVADEREEFAHAARFPEAERVLCGPFLELLPEIAITKRDYVAIVTRGHSCDGDCLFYILNHEIPGYLGMIGSRRRVRAQFDLFLNRGVPREKLALVHNPIGLPIHAVSPQEIAVSILAELILEKRTRAAEGIVKTELDDEVIGEWLLGEKPCAAATILHAQGSSPRKAGAKMLIFPDGSIQGSVGGGLCERKVIERGQEIIGSGKAFLFHFVMDADVAARVGMACGGTVDILIEDIRR